jgi:hypothetical protein
MISVFIGEVSWHGHIDWKQMENISIKLNFNVEMENRSKNFKESVLLEYLLLSVLIISFLEFIRERASFSSRPRWEDNIRLDISVID